MKAAPSPLPPAEEIDLNALARTCLDHKTDLVVVLGPTASGKTKYAVKFARIVNDLAGGSVSHILSADSRQVYRGMDIGTGKDIGDYGEIPCHLIDVANPGDGYNVHRFQGDFLSAWRSISADGCVPILCGGTGLYTNSVLNAYDFDGSIPLSEKRNFPADDSFPQHPYVIGTLVDRQTRNARIDARLDARLEEGMVDEIKKLLDDGVPAATLISYGLEYKFVTQYVLGELSYEQMRVSLATAIHQFAKRQMTWFRGMERSGLKIHWVNP